MPITVICQSCGARLKAPDEQAGRKGKCPKCQAAIELTAAPPVPAPANQGIIEAFRVAEPVTPAVEALASPARAEALDVSRRGKRRKKKRKTFFGGFELPSINIEMTVLGPLLGLGLMVAMGYAGYYIVRNAMRMPPPPVIAAERWQPVEVPNRVKCLLPGPANRVSQPVPGVAGMQMIMYSCQPDKDSIYALGYMDGELPAERRNLPVETLLNDACDGSIRNTERQGAVESGRESIQLGPFPGKQISSTIARAGAKTVARIYMAHGHLYIVMAGAVGLENDHANVKRLFDSFEILDTGGPPPAQIAAGPPAATAPEAAADKLKDASKDKPQAANANPSPKPAEPAAPRTRDRRRLPPPSAPPVQPAVAELSLPALPPAVPIKPPALPKDEVVLDQAAPIDALAVGGGGRFLIFHCAD
ncbi:MAG TPA: hypothetical protein VG099_31790, partial [Gemmataceae bacterium]|nr:hypothetical protein [Gemmataceae bacterium]